MESLTLCFELKWPGTRIVSVAEGKKGLELTGSENPDVIILDLGLPDIDGYEVLRQIRDFSNVPVIILTAQSEESNIVKGLEMGADDYVTKPFEPAEFLARVKAIAYRGTKNQYPKFTGGLACSTN